VDAFTRWSANGSAILYTDEAAAQVSSPGAPTRFVAADGSDVIAQA